MKRRNLFVNKFVPYVYSHGIYFGPESDDINPYNAYMWDSNKWTRQLTIPNIQEIGADTVHAYAYRGFFKPDLTEVLRSFTPELKNLISTKIKST